MVRRLLPLLLLLGMVAVAPSRPAVAGQQNFALMNRTGYQIDEVYVSRTTSRAWGSDVMGDDSLENGHSVNITFQAPDNVCKWDLRVKYNDGDEATWEGLNLCNISKVTLFWDKKREATRAVTE